MIRWLASYPKSGNTWLRFFLSAYTHGRLDINSPTGFRFDDLGAYVWQVVAPSPLDKLTPLESVALRGAVLIHMRAANGDQYVKTHSCIGTVSGFPMIPWSLTDRAIYVVRDPRAVAVSLARYLDDPIDEVIEMMALADHCFAKAPGLFNTMGTWSAHVKSWAGERRFPVLMVRYEDLGRETFAKVLQFLGLELDDERLDLAMKLTAFDTLRAQEARSGFAEQGTEGGPFFRRGKTDAPELSPEQARRIVDQHGEVMEEFGYGESSEGEGRGARNSEVQQVVG